MITETIKDPQAVELLNRRNALIKRMANPDESLTTEQVVNLTDECEGLSARAELVQKAAETAIERARETGKIVGTPEVEGDAESPEYNFGTFVDKQAKDINRYFAGPSDYIKRARIGLFEGGEKGQQARVFRESQEMYRRMLLIGATDEADQMDIMRTITGGAGSAEALLPLEQVASIFQAENLQNGIMATAQRYPANGRTLRIPYVVQTDTGSGPDRPISGIAAVAIIAEGAAKDIRENVFLERLLTVYKYAAISQIGDETLADDFTGQMVPTITRMVGGEVMNAMNDHQTISGTGVAMPIGAFNPTAVTGNLSLLTAGGGVGGILRETALTITVDDVFDMYAKHLVGPNSRWYINRTALAQLWNLTLSGNTLVTYLDNLKDAVGWRLLGIPVVVSDFLPVLGSAGDLCLGNGAFYACAMRQALTVESSIHFAFSSDVTTYRFLARSGGLPIPDGPYSYKSDGAGALEAPYSPFVRLGPAV